MRHYDVVVVGSGFAGSILARCLNAAGRSVLVVERGEHPRFALGESSTPLANLCLERLALRYDLEDLYQQAAWGRWCDHLGRQGGLKRGFTFFAPRAGDEAPPRDGLWVAASPNDGSADSQWLRSSVDAALVRRARSEGVEILEQTEVLGCSRRAAGWRLELRRRGERQSLEAGFVVDASGGGRFAMHHFGAGDLKAPRASLVYGHFEGVPEPPTPPGAPYASAWSAVHHLLSTGWMYELRFANGLVSAGILHRGRHDTEHDPLATWRAQLESRPWLAARYRDEERLRPVASSRIGYRSKRAYGEGWALLPHSFAFIDPLFSTGLAWSLLGVERVAQLLIDGGDWRRYEALLEREVAHISALLDAAYGHLADFDRFRAVARAYFLAASFHESCQRLLTPTESRRAGLAEVEDWCWSGFLGATDEPVARLFADLAGDPFGPLASAIAERDVAGMEEDRPMIDVDLEPLRENSHRLGLDRAMADERLPRLFSPPTLEQARSEAAGLGAG